MPRNKLKNTVIVEELEPRILFSAGGLDDVGHVGLADQTLERVLAAAELPAAEQQPIKQEFNSQYSTVSASSSVLSTTYYLDDVNGLSDKPVGDLKETVPTDTALIDYNESGNDDGLQIAKGGINENEADSAKYQTWLIDASNETLQGAVNLNIWSALKGFTTDKPGRVDVYLVDSDFTGTNLTVIASDSISRSDWDVTNSATWIEDTFDFGNVDHTFAPNRFLGVKIIVHNNSDDDMMFAYDTTTYAARLTISPSINTVVVDTAVDEDNGDVTTISALIANPGGAGISFREALQAANNTANGASPDRIHFDIPGTPAITMTGVLPAISEAVIIDGTTDSDYAPNSTPVIELNGQGIINTGLRITGDNVILRGLAVNNFVSHGIEITGDNNRIESSYIGISRDGLSASGNTGLGIRINNGANNQIGAPGVGNVISGNSLSGIAVVGTGSNSNIIESNKIGTNANGTGSIANGDYGIDLWGGGANNNRIGGDSLAQRNVISGNGWAGIHISGGGGNIVSGNYIGGNGRSAGASNNGGIDIDNSSNNQIGGVAIGELNIIAFNTGEGVRVDGAISAANSILGNEIHSNTSQGIELLSGSNAGRLPPSIASAAYNGVGNLSIGGSYSATGLAGEVLTLEFFRNPAAANEARTFLGSDTITLDSMANQVIDSNIMTTVTPGEFLTATITDNSGNTSEFATNVLITLNANNPPQISNLGGDVVSVENDGTPSLIDTDLAAEVSDIDNPADFDGGFIQFTGSNFSVNDILGLDTSGPIALSAGISDGSALSVSGTIVGTISASGASGFSVDLNPNSNAAWVNEILRAANFSSTSTILGARGIGVQFDDGESSNSASISASVTVLVSQAGNGLASTTEDTSYTFVASDFDFTGVVGSNLLSIEVLSLPSRGTLTLNGSSIAVNTVVSKADIDAGLLQFVPDPEDSASNYASFNFQVNNGLLNVSVLSGEPGNTLTTSGFTNTDAMLASASNFGLGGTVPTSVNVIPTSTSIDAAYLAQGDIFFDGGNQETEWTSAELNALDTWVMNGGVLITANDRGDRDAVSESQGLVIPTPGAASPVWTIADDSSPIINGPFGLVGNNGGSINGAVTLAFFDSASIASSGGGQVVVTDSITGEATLVVRPHGNGWIVFSGDEGIFRGESGSNVTTTRDRFIANTFAWAIDKLPGEVSHTMDITVASQNDAPVLTNNSLSVTEGIPVTITGADLSATDIDNDDGDLIFHFSSVSGGFFALTSSPNNPVVSATQQQVSTSQLRFVHDGGELGPSYDISVSDGTASTTPSPALISFSIANDAPAITANGFSISEGQTVTVSSADIAATDPDNGDSGLLFNFTNVTGGHFARASTPETPIFSVLQSQISASELIFVHDGSEAVPAWQLTASDSVASSPVNSSLVNFSNLNDVPRIDNLSGNSVVAFNDGSILLLDTDVPASVFDADFPIDINGAILRVQGISFDGQDRLHISSDPNVTLSNGLNNGSQVSVGGTVVATLSSVSASGFLINLVSPATTVDADAILSRLAFSSTASLFGTRDVDVQYSDGFANSDIATVSVLVTSSAAGIVSGTEDQTYTFTLADFDFTGVTGSNLESIEILGEPSNGMLFLNTAAVSVGQVITSADILAGALTFTPSNDANGNNYADFSFHVNNGIVSTNVLAGQTGSPETLEILQESNNFGLGGVYPTAVNIVSPNGAIDSDYLSQGSILFDSAFNNIGWNGAQLLLLDTWVKDGGVLIASSDNTSFDDIAEFYGLVIGGDSASTWEVALSADPVFNGRFGPVGANGTSLATGGVTRSYFLSSSLAAEDRVLAIDPASGEPTIVLRQLVNGWILFTGDENVFDSAMAGGGTISTTNDRFAANVFDWAIDQLPPEQVHTLNISIAAVNDPSTATNTKAAETYTEDTSLDLIDIVISDIDSSTVNAKLSVSSPSAGILSTGSAGSASSTYDAVTGVWQASGGLDDVNTLLANLTFTPAANFEQDFTIDVDITDGGGPQISDSKAFTAVPVNDAPFANAGGPYLITEGDGVSFDGSSSFDGDAGDSVQSFQWDLLKGGDVLATDVGSTLSWNQLAGFGVNDDGVYQVRLTVSDQAGAQNSDVSSLSVSNLDPVFNVVGPAIAYQDDVYELSLEVIDPGDDRVNQWLIDWGDGTVQNVLGTEAFASHVYSTGGITPIVSIIADTDEGQFAAATLAISVVPNAAPVGEVVIDNMSPIEEDILTVSNTLADDDGLSGLISYQWLRDGAAISGANETSYTVTAEDIGTELSVQASYIDDRNTSETVNSSATEVVQAKNRAASLDLEVQSIEIEENNDSSQSIRLTTITIQDDGLGENTLSLSGEDADKFEIVDGVLYLKAGVELDYEQVTRLQVQVNIDDPEVDGIPDDSEVFIVNVGDVAQEFFVPLEKVQPSTPPATDDDEAELEAASANQVAQLEFAEEEFEQERGELPGGTSSALQEQAIDVSNLLSVVVADQVDKGLFLEKSDVSISATVVHLADVIDLDNVEVRQAAITLLGDLPGIDPMEDFSMMDNSAFTSGLDELRRGVAGIDLSDKIVVGSSATVTTGLSIGYVLWMIRGSVLLSTILSSLPAWRLIDPLPVISGVLSEEEDDESLESIIEDGSNSEPDSPDADSEISDTES